MKLYAVIFSTPLSVIVEHFYTESRVSFKNYKKIIGIYTIVSVCFFWVLNYFLHFNSVVKIEYIAAHIIGIAVGFFERKLHPKEDLKVYAAYENIVYYPLMFLGFLICAFTFTKIYEEKVILNFSQSEALLSRIIYIRWGLSYIFYNRCIFCKIYKFLNKK